MDIITAGALASALIEVVKWLIRRFYYKDPNYDFSPKFYTFLLTVISFLVQPLATWINTGSWDLPATWQEWVFEFVRVLVTALLALLTNVGIKAYKVYKREYALMKH
jgi:hypothetical protein